MLVLNELSASCSDIYRLQLTARCRGDDSLHSQGLGACLALSHASWNCNILHPKSCCNCNGVCILLHASCMHCI